MDSSAALFQRVLCGVDDSPASVEAVRQAQRLIVADGTLHLLAVVDLRPAVHASRAAATAVEEVNVGARDALARAVEHTHAASAKLVEGEPVPALIHEIDLRQATLLALAGHRPGRAAGILAGDTVTTLLREAPCSVLVARPPGRRRRVPSSIIVGVDGSTHSRRALAAAEDLANRLDVPVRPIAALGGKPLSPDGLRDVPMLEYSDAQPLDALLAASAETDLVVLGNRGLHGFGALGSVSERVAHQAPCSALVVRGLD